MYIDVALIRGKNYTDNDIIAYKHFTFTPNITDIVSMLHMYTVHTNTFFSAQTCIHTHTVKHKYTLSYTQTHTHTHTHTHMMGPTMSDTEL